MCCKIQLAVMHMEHWAQKRFSITAEICLIQPFWSSGSQQCLHGSAQGCMHNYEITSK